MTIRRARAEEIPAISALAQATFLTDVAPLFCERGVATFLAFAAPDAIAKRVAEHSVAYLAMHEAEIVGMGMLKNASHISMLFVAPGQQRKGVGRRLVEFLCSEAHAPIVTVFSSPNAEAAYRRFGFTRTADERVVDGVRYVPMARELNPPITAPTPSPAPHA